MSPAEQWRNPKVEQIIDNQLPVGKRKDRALRSSTVLPSII
jgi:hypothetical protein